MTWQYPYVVFHVQSQRKGYAHDTDWLSWIEYCFRTWNVEVTLSGSVVLWSRHTMSILNPRAVSKVGVHFVLFSVDTLVVVSSLHFVCLQSSFWQMSPCLYCHYSYLTKPRCCQEQPLAFVTWYVDLRCKMSVFFCNIVKTMLTILLLLLYIPCYFVCEE